MFDERSTLGLVKLRTKKATYAVASILEDVARNSANLTLDESSFFAEITDEDIDSLFG